MGSRFKNLLVCGLLVMGSTANGQEADQEETKGGLAFVDEVQVTVVNIDVFVRDRQGNAVTGLAKEEFRLLQDGRERNLSHFAAYTDEVISEIMARREENLTPPPANPSGDRAPAEAASDQNRNPTDRVQPVHVILYVDNENIRPFDRNRVLTQVRQYIDEVMQPHVEVMVISVQRSPKIVQSFTNDPQVVKNALRSLTRVYGARTDADRLRGRLIHDMQAVVDDSPNEGLRADQRAAQDLQQRIYSYAEELSMELGYSVNSMREVLTTLAGLPGRRILVHI